MIELHHIKITGKIIHCAEVNTFIDYVKIYLDNTNVHMITGTSVYVLASKDYSGDDRRIISNLIGSIQNSYTIDNYTLKEITKIELPWYNSIL